ncbi:hypothetical protein FHR87_000057 [Azomonas macrocytogenes]|uniref:Uncharacterized protein n=1 Tax=Azomonas macrocytogenes TaxID=69962 RepID=A0A839SWC1_AZOMA|nr:hypothetical protein [Azomonas macrocytogenes]
MNEGSNERVQVLAGQGRAVETVRVEAEFVTGE